MKMKLPTMPPPRSGEIADNKQVSMSNALTRAAHGLLLSEKRLIMLGIANTDQKLPVTGNSGWLVTIHASDYAKQFDVDIDTAYLQLKSAAKKLFSRYVRGCWWAKPGSTLYNEMYFRWVSSATYLQTEGKVVINFSPEIVPHLIELKTQFTSYKLKTTSLFESIYAWRLYELLLSLADKENNHTFTVLDFRNAMDCPPSHSKSFGLLRVNVIEPAVKQINEKSDLKILEVEKDKKGNPVFFEAIKKGKTIDSIKFYFKKDEQLKMNLPKPSAKKPKVYTKDDLDKDSSLARPGETYEQALRRLNVSK